MKNAEDSSKSSLLCGSLEQAHEYKRFHSICCTPTSTEKWKKESEINTYLDECLLAVICPLAFFGIFKLKLFSFRLQAPIFSHEQIDDLIMLSIRIGFIVQQKIALDSNFLVCTQSHVFLFNSKTGNTSWRLRACNRLYHALAAKKWRSDTYAQSGKFVFLKKLHSWSYKK